MRHHLRNTTIAALAFGLAASIGLIVPTKSTASGASDADVGRSVYQKHYRYPVRTDHNDLRREIRVLSVKLDRAASRLHRSAELSTRRPTYRDEKALYDLHCLEEATGHFRRRVEHHRGLRSIERELKVLKGAYRTVRRSFYSLDPLPHVEEHFYDVDRLLGELKWRIENRRWGSASGIDPYYDRDRHRWTREDDWDRDRVWLLPKRSRPNLDR